MEVILTGDQQEKVTEFSVITYVCSLETFITFCICSIEDFELVYFNKKKQNNICVKLFIVENSITSIRHYVDEMKQNVCGCISPFLLQ